MYLRETLEVYLGTKAREKTLAVGDDPCYNRDSMYLRETHEANLATEAGKSQGGRG